MGDRSVTAIELEPAVFEAVRSPEYLLRAFGRVYEAPGVHPVRAEARGYFERSSERFDLIYMPSVGGYAQMMIEPGNMVRTFEAHKLLRDHLSGRGVLAIWYPRGLDTKGVLTHQYVQTLARWVCPRPRTGTRRVADPGPERSFGRPPAAEELAAVMQLDLTIPGAVEYLPIPYEVPADPHFVPITDDRPYLAGNVRYILSMRQVRGSSRLPAACWRPSGEGSGSP